MAMRGKVLRDALAGPGLLIAEGQQYVFTLDSMWKSEIPPVPGLPVDLEFDSAGNITAIRAVSESQLKKEPPELITDQRQSYISPGFVITGISRIQLSAASVLLLSWSYLTAVSVQIPLLGELKFSFWQVLSYLNSGNMLSMWERPDNPGTGFYGFLAILAFAGPFLPYVWKDKRASLGGFLPLMFLSFVVFMIRRVAILPSESGTFASLPQPPTLDSVSFGVGTYLSCFVCLFFAVSSSKQIWKRPTPLPSQLDQSQKAAA